MSMSSSPFITQSGLVIQRVIVPLWILTGAGFKLYERDPGNLPSIIRETMRNWLQLDHAGQMTMLRTLIGLEVFAALVIALVPRLSRAMAIFMLSSFCAILLGEMYRNATKCGCFGSLPFKPWHMLAIDGSMLLGVIFLRPWRRASAPVQAPVRRGGLLKPALAMIPLLFVGLGVSFAVPQQAPKKQEPDSVNPSASQPEANPSPNPTQPVAALSPVLPPTDPNENPTPQPLPANWAPPADISRDWVGRSWRDIELFQWMKTWPKDLNTGKHYVVFYSRTCEHCQLMFDMDLLKPLDAPVAVVEIPHDATTLRPPDAWEMPPTGPWVEMLEMPLGCKYTIQTPLGMTIENGNVTCAKEGDHKGCLGLN